MSEEDLKASTVIRAAQRPAMMAWVPLDIFFIECFVLLLLVRFFGLWAVAALPLHGIPFLLTQNDPFWPTTLRVNFKHYFSVGNRNLRGRGVTFNAKQLRSKAKSDDSTE